MVNKIPIVTMNIARKCFADILAIPPRKVIEYRKLSPFWESRLEAVGDGPFKLRLLNGMLPPIPEALIFVDLLERDEELGEFRLHLGGVMSFKNWDRAKECPSSSIKPATKPPPVSKRREIFAALVGVQDLGEMNIHESETQIACKYKISSEVLLTIQCEGIEENWPPLSDIATQETAVSDYCIYTIKHPDLLADEIRRGGPTPFHESKRWVTGLKLWKEAQAAGVGFPVLLGDATDCSQLICWGFLTALKINDEGTDFTLDRVRSFSQEHRPQELVLRSTDEPIAPNFLKPYAICRTPDFLSEKSLTKRKAKRTRRG